MKLSSIASNKPIKPLSRSVDNRKTGLHAIRSIVSLSRGLSKYESYTVKMRTDPLDNKFVRFPDSYIKIYRSYQLAINIGLTRISEVQRPLQLISTHYTHPLSKRSIK